MMSPENKNKKAVCAIAIAAALTLVVAAELFWSEKVSAQTSAEVNASDGATSGGNTGGGNTSGGNTSGGNQQQTNVPNYLSNLYVWFLGFVGIAALFSIVRGGILYMFSGTSITSTAEARKHIGNAVFALIIAGFSYALLNAINPDLVLYGFDISQVIRRVAP